MTAHLTPDAGRLRAVARIRHRPGRMRHHRTVPPLLARCHGVQLTLCPSVLVTTSREGVAEAVVRDAQRLPAAMVVLARPVDRGKELVGSLPAGVLVAAQKLHKLLPGHGWNDGRRKISVTNRHYV